MQEGRRKDCGMTENVRLVEHFVVDGSDLLLDENPIFFT